MKSTIRRWRDQRGVALPVALVGLVAVSLLVTSALLTGATEAAISTAQLSGTRSLYDADAALQEYVGTVVAGATEVEAGVQTVTVAETGQQVRLTTALLGRREYAGGDSTARVISVLAEPMRQGRASGRAVLAMIRQAARITNMNIAANEGAVVGSDLEVGGNSKVIDRSALCSDTAGAGAVRHADGTEVSTRGSGEISGAVRESGTTGEDFMREVLSGYTLRELAAFAEVKFGAMYGEAEFPNNARPSSTNPNPKLNWGCPGGMGIACAPADTLVYKAIAIDAQGGAVDLQGDHGQGVLMIVNGHLQITGNFQFKGLLMVEGYIDMSGTGGQTGAKVEGSVVAFGRDTNQRSRVDESETQGNAVIAYNRCAVNAAQAAFNQRSRMHPQFAAPSAAFSWYEVVR